VDEIRCAEWMMIKMEQDEYFTEEKLSLAKDGQVQMKSKISRLNPALDEEGLLRGNSRIINAQFLSKENVTQSSCMKRVGLLG
jgi:hypothetical protein